MTAFLILSWLLSCPCEVVKMRGDFYARQGTIYRLLTPGERAFVIANPDKYLKESD